MTRHLPVPGTTLMPAFCASLRAAVLSPSMSSSSALGPTNVMPAHSQLGKIGVFGKKTIAWVNGVDAFFRCKLDNQIDIQIRNRALSPGPQGRPRPL